MNKQEFNQLVKLDMKRLMSKKFQYGMTMSGLLKPKSDDVIAFFTANLDGLCLTYPQETEKYWTFREQRIAIHWEACEYGNTNAEFICPECGKHTLALYNNGISFMCRQCTKAFLDQKLINMERLAKIYRYFENGTIKNTVWI